MLLFVFFFFSSRRRHTRLQGDWSSDVCSSDLHYCFGLQTRLPLRLQLEVRLGFSIAWQPRCASYRSMERVNDNSFLLSTHIVPLGHRTRNLDRKSTRLNSSHLVISYAVFCLKKKKYHELTRHARA